MSCTILLVCDDVLLRNRSRILLEGVGHRVLFAASGADALELARRLEEGIDLVLTHSHLPDMDGPTLVARLRAVQPDINALLMSEAFGSEKDPSMLQRLSPSSFLERIRAALPKTCVE